LMPVTHGSPSACATRTPPGSPGVGAALPERSRVGEKTGNDERRRASRNEREDAERVEIRKKRRRAIGV